MRQPREQARLPERVVAVVPNCTRRTGRFGVEGFNIILTDSRAIFARLTSEMVRNGVRQTGYQGVAEAAASGATIYRKYLSMSADEALLENAENFSVNLSDVRRARLTEARKTGNPGESVLEIETQATTYAFLLPGESHNVAYIALWRAGLIK